MTIDRHHVGSFLRLFTPLRLRIIPLSWPPALRLQRE
jgi:hypothetical protein